MEGIVGYDRSIPQANIPFLTKHSYKLRCIKMYCFHIVVIKFILKAMGTCSQQNSCWTEMHLEADLE